MNLIDTLGWSLLHFLWQGAAIALFFFLADAVLRNATARARYAAACGAMLLMLSSAVGTFVWLHNGSQPAGVVSSTPTPASAAAIAWKAQADSENGIPAGLPAAPAATANQAAAGFSPYLPALVYLWIVGVVVLTARSLGGWILIQRLKHKSAQPAGSGWERRLEMLAGRLGIDRAVRLRESVLAEVPAVIGWLRPVVLVPASALSGLAPQQLEALLAHELAHIRRHDYLFNLMQTAVETLLFYHPAVWWIGRKIRAERENCCDDLAVEVCGDALVYARALARLEQLRQQMPQLAMASNRGPLLARIERLISARRAPASSSSGWPAAASILLCVAAVWAAPYLAVESGFGRPQQPAEPPTATKPAAAPKPVAPVYPEASGEPVKPASPAKPVRPPAPVTAVPTPQPAPDPAAVPAPPPPKPVVVPDAVERIVEATEHLAAAQARVREAAEGAIERHAERLAAANEMIARAAEVQPRVEARVAQVSRIAAALQAAIAGQATSSPAGDEPAGAYIDELEAAGYTGLTVDELIKLKLHGVTPEFAHQMRDAGLNPTADELTKLRIHGVTPEFVEETKAAELMLTLDELVKFRIHGVDIDAVKEMNALGYKLTPAQMVKMRIHGVTPALAREMRGFTGGEPSFEQLIKMRIHGVTPEFAAAMQQAGLQDLTAKQLIQLRIHGADPEQIRAIKDLGYSDLSVETVVKLRIHGVTPEFISAAKRHGFDDLDLDKLIQLKQLGIIKEPAFI